MARAGIAQALKLAASNRAAEAVALVEREAAAGDAEASYLLGLWRLEGQHLPRDLCEAGRLVARAESHGLLPAARTLSAFLSLGIGSGRDWPAALALLRRWRDRDPIAARQLELIAAMSIDEEGDPTGAFVPEVVSATPWIASIPGFFSPAEISFLLDMAEARFKPALAFDEASRRFVSHPFRTATAAGFPAVLEWPAIHALNRRIAAASDTHVARGEPLQILRYEPGQHYREHLDAVPGLVNQRVLTVLIALSDGFDGGATRFPRVGFEWRGASGEALVFRNADENGRPHQSSLHAGAPVESGVKLIASRWIRQTPPPTGEAFGRHETLSKPGEFHQ